MATPRISVVMPTYNRVDRLRRALAALAAQTAPRDSFEVVVVSDGSTDGTAEELDSLVQSNPAERAIHFSRNFGHMAALSAGMEAARATGAVITMDADGQHPPELLPALVALPNFLLLR